MGEAVAENNRYAVQLLPTADREARGEIHTGEYEERLSKAFADPACGVWEAHQGAPGSHVALDVRAQNAHTERHQMSAKWRALPALLLPGIAE
jgi:hypothetical protein